MEMLEKLGLNDVGKYTDQAVALVMEHGPRLLLAVFTLIIGMWVIRFAGKIADRVMKSQKVDPTLGPFLHSLVSWGLKALLFISVASMVGIETTSFVAVLGAAGLAVGLALQGSLANFAGGALILLFRPYKVGDLIQAQGHLGVVKEIQIFTTVLVSPENKRIILPNGPVANGDIVNFTAEGRIRVDLTIGVAYEADLDQAKEVLMKVLKEQPHVLSEPAPFVAVSELADSSVNFAVRPHCAPEHYWDVYFGVTEQCKKQLDKAGIGIPFPQRDVHLFQHNS